MTREKFIKVLDREGYSYRVEGNKIVVTSIFKGTVDLRSLKSLPLDVVFRNGGHVNLDSLTSIPPGMVFKNGWSVNLDSLTSIPPGVEFRNGGDVGLNSIIGGDFNEWKGNIEGVTSKMLLNLMIKRGMFI